jgi:hypothetical protein
MWHARALEIPNFLDVNVDDVLCSLSSLSPLGTPRGPAPAKIPTSIGVVSWSSRFCYQAILGFLPSSVIYFKNKIFV